MKCSNAIGASLAVIASLCLADGTARACVNPTGDGPTVALVLSGGGALANTQIGAMSMLEEMDIPIHCIVGTSMGSVVGAFYAAGYEVEEIRQIFREAPWPALMGNTQPRKDVPYLEKERRDEYYSDYIAGVTSKGLQLPGGLIGMDNLLFYFRQRLNHVPLDADFDRDLRVPYRAVAMNLSTGDAHAFAEGDLVESILASMAVPGVFKPRYIDGEVYVDGGLAQNLPVQSALDMGADIVIGIDLTIEPPRMDRRVAITDLTLQLSRLTVWKTYQEQVELLSGVDVVIRPDIEGLGVGSFERADLGYARGREAVVPHQDALARVREIAAPASPQPIVPVRPKGVRDDPRIVNETKIRDGAIEERLAFSANDLNDPDQLQSKLRDLASFGGFGEVDLAISGITPVLSVEERPLGTTLLQAGARATSNFDGDSNFAVLGRISRRPLLPGGGEFSISGAFGTNLGVTAELYKPFGDEGRFFFQPTLAYRAEELYFDVDGVRLGEFWQQSTTLQMRLGREFGRWGLLSLDALITDGRIRPQVAIQEQVFENEDYFVGGVGLRFAMDTLDNLGFPTRGTRVTATAQRLADVEDADANNRFRLSLVKAATFGRTTVNLRVRGASVETESGDPVEIFSLGGFRQLSAFSQNSLPNDQYLLGIVEVFRRFGALDQVASLPIYAGLTLEYANLDFEVFDPDLERNVGTLGAYLGADTVLGPVFLGVGVSDEGRYSFFLNLGRQFR